MTMRADFSFPEISPEQYLDLARDLITVGGAAALRTAVDRGYYAAFLQTRDELSRKGYGPFANRAQTHTEVGLALRDLDRDAGNDLRILRWARNRLTYETERAAVARNQSPVGLLALAQSVIDAVDALPPAPRDSAG